MQIKTPVYISGVGGGGAGGGGEGAGAQIRGGALHVRMLQQVIRMLETHFKQSNSRKSWK